MTKARRLSHAETTVTELLAMTLAVKDMLIGYISQMNNISKEDLGQEYERLYQHRLAEIADEIERQLPGKGNPRRRR